MSVITDVEKWGNSHRPGFLDIFRIAMGVFITYKGLYFITHMTELETTTSGVNVYFAGAALAHYVVFAHILGGPLSKLSKRLLLPRTTYGIMALIDRAHRTHRLHDLWRRSLFH